MPRPILALIALLALAGCAAEPQPARPAFWSVTGPDGQRGWMLGTIHALPRPSDWRSPAINEALAEADTFAVEIADLDDRAGMSEVFARLGKSPGLPPLSTRIDPALRAALDRQLEAADMEEGDFAETETWSAALTLARAEQDGGASANGIDRALLRLKRGKRVIELEGTEAQLGLFDQLPEKEQRDLLNAVLLDAARGPDGTTSLVEAWRNGDFAAIEAETHRGMLADPELREALFTGRNRAWAGRIDGELRARRRVFVAVGAAHMAGTDGLAAMLAARGWAITRIQ